MKTKKEITDVMRQKPFSENKVTGLVTEKGEAKVLYMQLHDGTKIKVYVADMSVI